MAADNPLPSILALTAPIVDLVIMDLVIMDYVYVLSQQNQMPS